MNEQNNSGNLIDITCGNIIYTDSSNDKNDTDDKYIEKNQDERNIKYDNVEILNYTNNSHVVNILQYDEDDIESEYNSNIHEHNLNFTKILKILIFAMIMFLCILLFYAIR